MGRAVVLFPTEDSLSAGDVVWVYKTRTPFAQGVVQKFDESSHRYVIEYQDGSTYRVRRARLVKVYSDCLLVCGETDQYRKLAFSQMAKWSNGAVVVQNESAVLEIGCAEGECTVCLIKSGIRNILAVDKSQECVETAARRVSEEIRKGTGKERYENGESIEKESKSDKLNFAVDVKVMDVFQVDWEKEIVGCNEGRRCFEAVFVDINGNRELPAVLKVINLVETHLKPRLIVVKARSLAVQIQNGKLLQQ